MTTSILPGSYDPVTLGHLDVIARAAALFDEVVVAVLHNPDKSGLLTPDERVQAVRDSLDPAWAGRVRVEAFAGRLLVDVAREVGATVVVKGIRSGTDLDYETPMAAMNRSLTGLETLFLPADGALAHISSSLVKQVAAMGGDFSENVSEPVAAVLRRKFSSAQ